MAVNLSPVGGVAGQFFDNNGNPLSGGKIFTYAAGTTTNQVTYTSATGLTAHSNPIILDSGGRVPSGEIWLTDGLQYKFVIKSNTDVLIGTFDNVTGINSNFVNYTVQEEIQTATAGQTVFTLTTMQYAPATNSLSVFVDGVNQYGGGSYSYIETSPTVVTFTAGLHVGAEVKFTTAVFTAGSVGNAANVTYDPAGTGAVAISVQNKLRQYVSVKDFGAVGDGIADDTVAITTAIQSGYPLDWGRYSYRITSGIVLTITHRVDWQSFGAAIFLDASTSQASAIRLNVSPHSHIIKGEFTIDANRKAHVGLYLANGSGTLGTYPEGYPDVVIEDIRIRNVHRASTAIANGDGLLIVGGWNRVSIVRPYIQNVTMALGAGIAGSQGVSGITVADSNALEVSPHYVSIVDCFIDSIYSEDPTFRVDQDGIRVFSNYNNLSDTPRESNFMIRGGTIRNSRNRSIKSQMQWGIIDGLKLIKTSAIDIGNHERTTGPDIDFQVGGGTVSNLEFLYEDFVANEVVRYTESVSLTKKVVGLQVSGIKGTSIGSAAIENVIGIFSSTGVTNYKVNVQNIEIVGGVNRTFRLGTGATGLTGRFSLQNAYTENLVELGSAVSAAGRVQAFISNCHQLGGTEVPLFTNVNNKVDTFAQATGCTGFTPLFDNIPLQSNISPRSILDRTNNYILTRTSTTHIINLPDPATTTNRYLLFKNLGTVAVESSVANVVPINSQIAGIEMFGVGTAGTWLSMISNGTNWIVMQRG